MRLQDFASKIFSSNLLSKPEARIVAANFLMQLGLQAIYFVGIIGCATYDLGADALVVSSLVLVLNVMLVVMSFVAGPRSSSSGSWGSSRTARSTRSSRCSTATCCAPARSGWDGSPR